MPQEPRPRALAAAGPRAALKTAARHPGDSGEASGLRRLAGAGKRGPGKPAGPRARAAQAAREAAALEEALADPKTAPPADPEPEEETGSKRRKRAERAPPPVVEIRPLAVTAEMHPRHHGLMISFALMVLVPVILAMVYLWTVSADQYASTVGFTVRREEGGSASAELLGGLAQFAGSTGSSETDILYEFIQSQEIVASIDERIGLTDLYAEHWPGDPLFSLWPDASIEDLQWYWKRMVRISYDQSSHLIELRVLAFEAEDAQRIAGEIVASSQRMINDLNTQAREDVMRYANEDLDAAVARLKAAREALSRFRTRTQIVDPAADIQGRMGVLNNLQQQLAEALIEYDIVLGTTNEGDPRRVQSARRIEVIRDRIAAERQTFATSDDVGIAGENYPTLIAEFESLTVDMQFAEETYRAALAGVDVARAKASRQTLYLAPYINPTLPQTAEFPQRFVLAGLIALFLGMAWAIMTLVYYSIRDRR